MGTHEDPMGTNGRAMGTQGDPWGPWGGGGGGEGPHHSYPLIGQSYDTLVFAIVCCLIERTQTIQTNKHLRALPEVLNVRCQRLAPRAQHPV